MKKMFLAVAVSMMFAISSQAQMTCPSGYSVLDNSCWPTTLSYMVYMQAFETEMEFIPEIPYHSDFNNSSMYYIESTMSADENSCIDTGLYWDANRGLCFMCPPGTSRYLNSCVYDSSSTAFYSGATLSPFCADGTAILNINRTGSYCPNYNSQNNIDFSHYLISSSTNPTLVAFMQTNPSYTPPEPPSQSSGTVMWSFLDDVGLYTMDDVSMTLITAGGLFFIVFITIFAYRRTRTQVSRA